jgi:hypothetical protein
MVAVVPHSQSQQPPETDPLAKRKFSLVFSQNSSGDNLLPPPTAIAIHLPIVSKASAARWADAGKERVRVQDL